MDRDRPDARRSAPAPSAPRGAAGERVDPSVVCPACGFESEPFRCKIVCPRCRVVVESCSDGGEVPPRR